MLILAIESSCDETAVAIIHRDESGEPKILASEISSQIDIHRKWGGVVPELASRNHSLALSPLIQQALENAEVGIQDIDAFAATSGPGLASSLLVGNTAAKALSVATGKPYIAVNHMEGHLISPFLQDQGELPANIALIVSGGHTLLIHMKSFGDYELLGTTLDDAAGEAFDKVAKMIGLPYPGGPEIEKAAKSGNPAAFALPRSMMKEPNFNFSFSGLKTAVLYTISDLNPDDGAVKPEQVADLCASFQAAVIEVLVKKTIKAARKSGVNKISLSGGVSCNRTLQQELQKACDNARIELHLCQPALSTDNAAMIAFVALHKYLAGEFSSLDQGIDPNQKLV
ncbi:tRNA (adenosine(37)-N6)-threonylcarbamoyltransferase complex transferase subunit TsaD [Persicirhabdus sediminis]|uniref:tRNA N6-adenosine threonylcarbamoyltransferase n=1 Tax=Persicirhabdus sediminis TaxID=454144 RepID=A0A8J7MKE4_9BACT|nr:tRNA (adenosine(37)-N6)-threonylcarbamoyltransferase complex transferase subunit TsaD [Persicirhabdus sediminis]